MWAGALCSAKAMLTCKSGPGQKVPYTFVSAVLYLGTRAHTWILLDVGRRSILILEGFAQKVPLAQCVSSELPRVLPFSQLDGIYGHGGTKLG
jgi:hypothetical protein